MRVTRLALWGVLALVALGACSSGTGGWPATGAEARNGQAPIKKRRKVPPPVLAPPPRYGNKIVEHTSTEAPLPRTLLPRAPEGAPGPPRAFDDAGAFASTAQQCSAKPPADG